MMITMFATKANGTRTIETLSAPTLQKGIQALERQRMTDVIVVAAKIEPLRQTPSLTGGRGILA